jgi:hypothetical protein
MHAEDTMGLIDTAKKLFGQHPEQATDAVEKAGDAVDDKTGGKHTSQVDTAQAKADGDVDKSGDQE